jgi:hypothetical protein
MAQRGIKITPAQNTAAIGIFPKVCICILIPVVVSFNSFLEFLQVAGLARKLRDNTTLGE